MYVKCYKCGTVSEEGKLLAGTQYCPVCAEEVNKVLSLDNEASTLLLGYNNMAKWRGLSLVGAVAFAIANWTSMWSLETHDMLEALAYVCVFGFLTAAIIRELLAWYLRRNLKKRRFSVYVPKKDFEDNDL